MINGIRLYIGITFMKYGMKIIPKEVRELVRKMLLFHVPGALTEEEKDDVIVAVDIYKKQQV